MICNFSDDESKKRKKSNENLKKKSSDVTKEIGGQTYTLNFSGCLKNLDNNRKTRKAKENSVVAISSGESDASGPITRLKPLKTKKKRIIRSSSDENEMVTNLIPDRPATPPKRISRRPISVFDSEETTDSIPQIRISSNRTHKQPIKIPDIGKLNDVQIVDSCDSMKEFDSIDAMVDGRPTQKFGSPDIILGKSKRNATSRRIVDKSIDQPYVAPVLPRFKKKKPPKKTDEEKKLPKKTGEDMEVDIQGLFPEIQTKPLTKPVEEFIENMPTKVPSESNKRENSKMGCLDTLAQMEESSDDNILQGWLSSENSQSGFVASSSRIARLDGPNRSKRLSKDLQSQSKRPRGDKPHPVYDAFRKSIRSPDKTSNKGGAFVSTISNKIRFDGGRHPKQRTRTEKENYEKRFGSNAFRTRDSSPNAIIEIFSSTEKKSKTMSENSRSSRQNVLQLSSDSD